MTTVVKATQTSWACPSQWDAEDSEGTYLYLRYRYGHGSVYRWPNNDDTNWFEDRILVTEFYCGNELDGCIQLEEFLELAGMELALQAKVMNFGDYLINSLQDALEQTYGG